MVHRTFLGVPLSFGMEGTWWEADLRSSVPFIQVLVPALGLVIFFLCIFTPPSVCKLWLYCSQQIAHVLLDVLDPPTRDSSDLRADSHHRKVNSLLRVLGSPLIKPASPSPTSFLSVIAPSPPIHIARKQQSRQRPIYRVLRFTLPIYSYYSSNSSSPGSQAGWALYHFSPLAFDSVPGLSHPNIGVEIPRRGRPAIWTRHRKQRSDRQAPPVTQTRLPAMEGNLVKNNSPNGWVVQKFGGTSVGKFPDKIAEGIIRYGLISVRMDRV